MTIELERLIEPLIGVMRPTAATLTSVDYSVPSVWEAEAGKWLVF
jgi:hypothetical protein